MKKQVKKLQLKRDTVIRLDRLEADLRKVAGGRPEETDDCEISYWCNSRYQCYT